MTALVQETFTIDSLEWARKKIVQSRWRIIIQSCPES
jgi:hypothetical protein